MPALRHPRTAVVHALDAPAKTWVDMPGAGHRPNFEQPDRFAALMRAVVAETR